MSILLDYLTIHIPDFRGPWLLLEPSDVPLSNALAAQNVEYLPGLVKTRYGFSSQLVLSDKIVSMVNWLAPTFNGITSFLAYLSTSGAHVGVDLVPVAGGTVQTLYNPAGSPVGASFAFGGYRLFMATYNSNIVGSDQGRVYSNANVLTFNSGTDKLFVPPVQYIPTFSDTGVGIVTAGTHDFAYLLTSRNGFSTQPSPVDSGGDFVTVSHTSPGAEQLTITITPSGPWATYWTTIQIAMTQVGGTQYFLVPGATGVVPFGTTFPVVITINIDDGTLAATGTDLTPYFDKLVQNQGGGGPFLPFFIGNYSQRLYYMALDELGVPTTFISNPNDYQTVTLDQNTVYLPGELPVTCGFSLYQVLYLVGPHWTYSTQDTGGVPVEWPAPQLIDGHVGTLSPLGITINASQGIAWVCDVAGLYVFSGGAYSTRPISYYQTPDWNRINWTSAAGKVQVVDNVSRKQVKVIVPLDGATDPNYIMTWDYTRGVDPESVSYSLDSMTSYDPSSAAIVQNPTTNRLETWVGPGSSSNPVLRQNDGTEPNPYRDNGLAILALYQTALMPQLSGAINRHTADQFRLEGQGNTYITALGLDGQTKAILNVVSEETYPAKMFLRRYDLVSEAISLQFQSGDIDAWFQLSDLTHYYSFYTAQR